MYKKNRYKNKPPIKKDELFNFEPLAKRISHYLKEDGMSLNFQGYTDTISQYYKLQDNNLPDVFELSIECNLWSQYFADIEGIIQYKQLDIGVELDKLKADFDKKLPNEQLENTINEMTIKLKDYTAFLSQINVRKKFFIGAYYHCYEVYKKGINTLNYKTVD